MFRRIFAPVVLVAMVATGCAGLSVQSKAGTDVALPDGSVVRPVGTFVQSEGTQMVSRDSYQCKPDKLDEAGKPVNYKDCTVVSSSNMGDDSPGAKAGKIMGGVSQSAILGAAIGVAADQTKQGMIGAAKARKPDTTTNTLENKPVTTNTLENKPVITNTSCSGTGSKC